MFLDLSKEPRPATVDDVPLEVLLPAFVVSELKTAFTMGFLLFIPFLVIDLVVASALMAMGMVMVSPTQIALPVQAPAVRPGRRLGPRGPVARQELRLEARHDAADRRRSGHAAGAVRPRPRSAAPSCSSSLVVGLVVSVFQAATQINEATLTFVPKLIVVAADPGRSRPLDGWTSSSTSPARLPGAVGGRAMTLLARRRPGDCCSSSSCCAARASSSRRRSSATARSRRIVKAGLAATLTVALAVGRGHSRRQHCRSWLRRRSSCVIGLALGFLLSDGVRGRSRSAAGSSRSSSACRSASVFSPTEHGVVHRHRPVLLGPRRPRLPRDGAPPGGRQGPRPLVHRLSAGRRLAGGLRRRPGCRPSPSRSSWASAWRFPWRSSFSSSSSRVALLARAIPQINVFILGLPLKLLVGARRPARWPCRA